MCGGRRGILNLLLKLNSRCLENRCQRLLKLLKLHVQLLDGHCHLLLWSRHGLLTRGASRRAQLSYPQKLAHVWFRARTASPLFDCFALSLSWQSWHQRLPELSAPPDNKSLFQCSSTWSQSRSSVKQQSRLRYHVVNVWDWTTHTHTCFALGEGLQDSYHTCSRMLWLCVHKGWYCQTGLRFSICACHLQLTYCLNQARYRDIFWKKKKGVFSVWGVVDSRLAVQTRQVRRMKGGVRPCFLIFMTFIFSIFLFFFTCVSFHFLNSWCFCLRFFLFSFFLRFFTSSRSRSVANTGQTLGVWKVNLATLKVANIFFFLKKKKLGNQCLADVYLVQRSKDWKNTLRSPALSVNVGKNLLRVTHDTCTKSLCLAWQQCRLHHDSLLGIRWHFDPLRKQIAWIRTYCRRTLEFQKWNLKGLQWLPWARGGRGEGGEGCSGGGGGGCGCVCVWGVGKGGRRGEKMLDFLSFWHLLDRIHNQM